MSNVKVQGHPSGTGNLTIAAPNTNSDYTLNLPAASGTLLTNSGTEAGAFSTLSVNGNNISAQNSLGFRNRIINGDMRIDQRNAGAAVTITGADVNTYVLDRFYLRANSATGSRVSVQRSTVAPTGFTNSQLITSLSAYTLGATEHFGTTQAIEGFNIADLGWGTANAQAVTLSFWVRSSVTGTFGGHIANDSSDNTYVYSYTIAAANTWEFKTVTIPGPTTGTWATGNTAGLYMNFSVAAGSSVTRAVGWGAFARSVTGQTSLVATNGATFYITGVQLEAGSVATPFERRPYGTELALCQRYFLLVGRLNLSPSSNGRLLISPLNFPMRTVPSLSVTEIRSLDTGVLQTATTWVVGDTCGNAYSNTTGYSGAMSLYGNAFGAEL